jgi:hypothetical protein
MTAVAVRDAAATAAVFGFFAARLGRLGSGQPTQPMLVTGTVLLAAALVSTASVLL